MRSKLSKLYIVITFLLLSCEKGDFAHLDHIKVIGHGGMGISHDFPLNTYESIFLALNRGVDGVEIDVQMTRDSILVAYHHKQLEHSTEMEGQVHQKTWQELSNAEYHDLLYAEYRLVNLDIIFEDIGKWKDKTYFFDVKDFSEDTTRVYFNKLTNAIFKVIDFYQLTDVIIEAKSVEFAKFIKEKRPTQKVFLYGPFDQALELGKQGVVEGVTRPIDEISAEEVSLAHSFNMEVATLNTHSKNRNKEALNKNIDYNQTDMVNYLLRLLDN